MLRVLSYNIHKGFTTGNRSLATLPMKMALHTLKPDLLFLQEVVGQNELLKARHQNWPSLPQHEFFCSEEMAHHSYGKNAIYPEGHHGNAILSRLPFGFELNVDVTVYSFEKRGFLHASLEVADKKIPVHGICLHFGLLEYERRKQAEALCAYIEKNIPPNDALIVAGDSNDWRQKLSPYFKDRAGLNEVFLEFYGTHARTFPSWYPLGRLDRIYYRNLELTSCEHLAGKPWNKLSDHLPIIADFKFRV